MENSKQDLLVHTTDFLIFFLDPVSSACQDVCNLSLFAEYLLHIVLINLYTRPLPAVYIYIYIIIHSRKPGAAISVLVQQSG